MLPWPTQIAKSGAAFVVTGSRAPLICARYFCNSSAANFTGAGASAATTIE
jgi:hypothetical protein